MKRYDKIRQNQQGVIREIADGSW
jgi:hypothetical protein